MIIRVPVGARVYLGAPAQSMEQALVGSIAEAVALVPDIIEAHLPQCYVPEAMQTASQVLVLVVPTSCHVEPIVAAVIDRLAVLLPDGVHLDVWPVAATNSLLSAVRGAGCKIFDRSIAMVP